MDHQTHASRQPAHFVTIGSIWRAPCLLRSTLGQKLTKVNPATASGEKGPTAVGWVDTCRGGEIRGQEKPLHTEEFALQNPGNPAAEHHGTE